MDDNWNAEFRGFFYGEGSAEIGMYKRSTKAGYPDWVGFRPRLTITLRYDERPFLEEVQRRFGGYLSPTKIRGRVIHSENGRSYNARPMCMWRVTGANQVSPVLEILRAGTLNVRKRKDLEIVAEYIAICGGPGMKHTPELKARIQDLRTRLAALQHPPIED